MVAAALDPALLKAEHDARLLGPFMGEILDKAVESYLRGWFISERWKILRGILG